MKKLAYELGMKLAQEDFIKQAYWVPSLVGAGLGAGAGYLSANPEKGQSRLLRALAGAGAGAGLGAAGKFFNGQAAKQSVYEARMGEQAAQAVQNLQNMQQNMQHLHDIVGQRIN